MANFAVGVFPIRGTLFPLRSKIGTRKAVMLRDLEVEMMRSRMFRWLS